MLSYRNAKVSSKCYSLSISTIVFCFIIFFLYNHVELVLECGRCRRGDLPNKNTDNDSKKTDNDSKKSHTVVVTNNKPAMEKSANVTRLAEILRIKLEDVPPERMMAHSPTCNTKEDIANSCIRCKIEAGGGGGGECSEKPLCRDGQYSRTLPSRPEDAVASLVDNPKFKILPEHARTIKTKMTDQLHKEGDKQQYYDVILLTAASSNHFREAQAMLRNVHERLQPLLTAVLISFKLVMYDLGLNTTERRLMEAHCNCTVLDFPFSDFPSHVSDLICYAWKPLMIHAHMSQADLVMWWDASIRVEHTDRMLQLLQRARRVGVQQGYNEARFKTARFTAHEQFYYFGDEPCPYAPYLQLGGNFGIYHNEPFVMEAILTPHAACALVQECICPRPEWGKGCVKDHENPYGYCHRHDQSALTHILVKLYGLAYPEILADYTRTKREKMQREIPGLPFSVKRGDKEDYFGHVQ